MKAKGALNNKISVLRIFRTGPSLTRVERGPIVATFKGRQWAQTDVEIVLQNEDYRSTMTPMRTKIISKIQSNTDILHLLHAMSDSGYWVADDMSAWASEVLLQAERPSSWLMDLVIFPPQKNLDTVLRDAFLQNQVSLPEWIDELTAGFVMIRHENGSLTGEQTKDCLAALAGSNSFCGIEVADFAGIQLEDTRLQSVRQQAATLRDKICDRPISPSVLLAVEE